MPDFLFGGEADLPPEDPVDFRQKERSFTLNSSSGLTITGSVFALDDDDQTTSYKGQAASAANNFDQTYNMTLDFQKIIAFDVIWLYYSAYANTETYTEVNTVSIQTSDDGQTWTTIQTLTNTHENVEKFQNLSVGNITLRFLRASSRFTSGGGHGTGSSIWYTAFYGLSIRPRPRLLYLNQGD